MLSASVTPYTIAQNGTSASASELWSSLSQTLGVFTAVRYSRDGGVDGTALDAALSDARDVVRRLRLTSGDDSARRRHTENHDRTTTWAR